MQLIFLLIMLFVLGCLLCDIHVSVSAIGRIGGRMGDQEQGRGRGRGRSLCPVYCQTVQIHHTKPAEITLSNYKPFLPCIRAVR